MSQMGDKAALVTGAGAGIITGTGIVMDGGVSTV